MKYMLLFVDEVDWERVPEAESRVMFEKVGQWWGQHSQAGLIEVAIERPIAGTVGLDHLP